MLNTGYLQIFKMRNQMKNKLLVLAYLLLFTPMFAFGDGPIRVIFRYDDFLLAPSALSDSLLAIFRKNGVPLCVSIIPFDSSGNLINKIDSGKISDLILRMNSNELEIALHGYNHENHVKKARFSKSTYSEFATVPYELQYNRLEAGKKAIDSILRTNVRIFVPPFNTYDKNTLIALEKLKFEIISGQRQGTTEGNSLSYMPATIEDFSELPAVLKKYGNKDVTVIVYFHPYSFKGHGSRYSKDMSRLISTVQLDQMLNSLKNQNVRFSTFTDLSGKYNFSAAALNSNTFRYNLLKKVLNYFKLFDAGVFTSKFPSSVNILLVTGNILMHLLSFFLVFAFTGLILRLINPKLPVTLILLFLLLIPVAVFLFYIRNDFSFGIISAMVLVNICAVFLGIFRKYSNA
jgi:peptidoglycan/xylan/chitin deacetylase (PgdA/CDA1 family)